MDAEVLRQQYNSRFSGPAEHWTNTDIIRCRQIASRVASWAGMKENIGLSLLDVGCALGYYTEAFRLEGFDAYGLDYSEVAIRRASELHPQCHFFHADGFNPDPGKKFDLIFCKGFSGANTHDINFVASWTEKYISLLNPGGKFVFSYSSDYSGKEKDGETVNWTKKEIKAFIGRVNAGKVRIKHYYRFYIASRVFMVLRDFLKSKRSKNYFYIIFSRP